MAVPEYFRLTYYLKLGIQGWQESHALPTTTYEASMPIADRICRYRMAWGASNLEMTWGRISVVGRPSEARGIFGNPLKNIWVGVGDNALTDSDWQGNDPYVGPQFRLETGGDRPGEFAKWANRLLRGVPDIFIKNFNFFEPDIRPLGASQALPNPNQATANGNYVRRAFLAYMAAQTRHVTTATVEGVKQYTLTPFGTVLYRGIHKRDTGAPFGQSRGRRSAA